MTIRGRFFNEQNIKLVEQIVSSNPSWSRRRLSITICKELDWKQPNGRTKDRACRDVLLKLERDRIIDLPDPQWHADNKQIHVKSVGFVEPNYELTGTAGDYGKPRFKEVKSKKENRLWNYLVERYHYLGCKFIVGHNIKYFLYVDNYLVGCLAFGDGILHLGRRDRWIGWSNQQREINLHLIINNRRFLLLPWVKIKYLASRILGRSAKVVPFDWKRKYGYKPVLMETFIEKKRFKGISYKASNWICLGETVGKGRKGNKYFYHGKVKHIYVYPLVKNAREIMKSNGMNSFSQVS